MSNARILVTGSRDFDSEYEMRFWLNRAVQFYVEDGDTAPILVHGGARGADSIADKVWRALGYPVEVHPANWDAYGKSAGYRRNAEMAKLGADLCLAFPIGESKGTRMMMDLANQYGITTIDTSLYKHEVAKSLKGSG
jgi:hypothetical protein